MRFELVRPQITPPPWRDVLLNKNQLLTFFMTLCPNTRELELPRLKTSQALTREPIVEMVLETQGWRTGSWAILKRK